MKTTADDMGFDKTTGPAAEMYCADVSNKESRQTWIAKTGDEVGLKYRGKLITVCGVFVHPEGYLTGQIRGFGNYSASEFSGLQIGQTISFHHVHVFSLTAAD